MNDTSASTVPTKVLIVEDNSLFRNSVRVALEAVGFGVVEAKNGLEGLNMVNSDHPDIILLDVYMPEINGMEVLAQLKTNGILLKTPVIILTNVEEELERAMQMGAREAHLKINMSPIQVADLCKKYRKN